MNREYNPKQLRSLDRLCVYKCSNCSRIIFSGYDIKEGKTAVSCKSCRHYVDADRDIMGDSWYPDEFPEIRFTIDDNSLEKGKKPRLIVWFHTECPDCKNMSWIAWRNKWLDYSTCQCHEPIREDAKPVAPILLEHLSEDLKIGDLVIPSELVGRLKDYCFENDLMKKDVIIEALRQFFIKCEN